jgi:hypothetical protein
MMCVAQIKGIFFTTLVRFSEINKRPQFYKTVHYFPLLFTSVKAPFSRFLARIINYLFVFVAKLAFFSSLFFHKTVIRQDQAPAPLFN